MCTINTINNPASDLAIESKDGVDEVQAELAKALRSIGRGATADGLLKCRKELDGCPSYQTKRCNCKYCHKCRYRNARRYSRKLMPWVNKGHNLSFLTLGVGESVEPDWRLVQKARQSRAVLLNTAPFKNVLGSLCSIEVSWTGLMYFTHIHVLYLGDLAVSCSKSPEVKIKAWQANHFDHSHYHHESVSNTFEDVSTVTNYIYKGFKPDLFPFSGILPYVEATFSTNLVTARGCLRNAS
jgi:hypothetical protein